MSTPDDVQRPAAGHELTAELASGWTIHVRGSWHDDDGFSGGHQAGTRHLGRLPGSTVDELRAAMVQQRAEDERDAATPSSLQIRLVRDDIDVTVIDEQRLPADAPATLLWPPIDTTAGVVLRWERTRTSYDRPDGRPVEPGEAPHSFETTVQPAWIVSPGGGVGQLLLELGTSPVAIWPDGRLLMPSIHPLWWDGDDEPLTLMDLSGQGEPLIVDGEPVTPSRVLAAIGEEAANGVADAVDAPSWTFRQAALDDGRLRLRLTHDDDAPQVQWIAVEVGLDQRWAVRRIGTGEVGPGEPLPSL